MTLSPRHGAAAVYFVLFIVSTAPTPALGFREDTEQDLASRIQRENDPVKRAKLRIRLAHLDLGRGTEACEKDDHAACSKFLGEYLDLMRGSWKDLESSGRRGVKQPSGFKELDIALREDIRTLDDAKRRIPLEDRGQIDTLTAEIDKVRNQVLDALFPSGNPRLAEKKPAPPAPAHFASERAQ